MHHIHVWVSSLLLLRLFMVSIAHPNKYYQLFLSQGLCMGIGTGLIYVPSLAVQAHHWKRYRPLAMGVVITGMCWPLPLSLLTLYLRLIDRWNHLPYHAEPSFQRAYWVPLGGSHLGLSCPRTSDTSKFSHDRPTNAKGTQTTSSAPESFFDWHTLCPWYSRGDSCWLGFLLPLYVYKTFAEFRSRELPDFYLQLFAILKGVDPNNAFYLVCSWFIHQTLTLFKHDRSFLDCCTQCSIHTGATYT